MGPSKHVAHSRFLGLLFLNSAVFYVLDVQGLLSLSESTSLLRQAVGQGLCRSFTVHVIVQLRMDDQEVDQAYFLVD